MTTGSEFRVAVKRERVMVFSAIAILIVLAWAYTIRVAQKSAAMSDAMAVPNMLPWSTADFGYMFVMWAVMMVAMMLPSVTPMIFLYGLVGAKRESEDRAYAPTAVFVGGYLLAWVGSRCSPLW
jgi:predicted metal-binding membrane protein